MGGCLAYTPRAFQEAVCRRASRGLLRIVSGDFRSRWRDLPIAVRIVIFQIAVLLVLGLLLQWFAGLHQPFLLGGGCAVLPNAWMAWRIRHRPRRDPAAESWRVLLGAFEKLLLTGVLLTLALLRSSDLNAPAFFAGFIAALAAHHAALVFVAGEGREA